MSDLKLLTIAELATELGRTRHYVSRLVKAGTIPAAYIDDNGRPWFSRATLEAHQRRTGELAAERAS